MGDQRFSTATPLRLGLIGIGKIARDQHVPAIAADPAFSLVATASPGVRLDGVPGYDDIEGLLAGQHNLAAVSICTPPSARHAVARSAIDAGLHVMLEKPPGTMVAEVEALADHAARAGVTLFTAWHSRETAAVDAARAWLARRRVVSVTINWREDIRVWHPGQDWILETGGFGVFDPGINALSIATAILPHTLRVKSCTHHVPVNRNAPIASSLDLVLENDAPVRAEFDFLQNGPQTWNFIVETDKGKLMLSDGGGRLEIEGMQIIEDSNKEYLRLYRSFSKLILSGKNDIDIKPLQLVQDAFSIGHYKSVKPFYF